MSEGNERHGTCRRGAIRPRRLRRRAEAGVTAAPPTTDVAAIRERCMNDWLRGRGKDLTQAETDRADMVSLYDELFEVYVAVTARAKAAEAKAARVEAVISTIKSTAPYAGWDARFVDRTLKALDAALMGTDRKL